MFGSGSATASSKPTALREAGASGSGGSHHGHHIPYPNAPGCSRQKGKTHNGYLSDAGGQRATIIYTIAETAKLNGLDPEAYIAAVLDRLAGGHPITRIHELLPWNFKAERQPAAMG